MSRLREYAEWSENFKAQHTLDLLARVDNGFARNSIVAGARDEEADAVVVFSSTTPQKPGKFLIHLLLSMGEYTTEFDLFHVPTLRDSFVNAGFISNDVDTDLLHLCRRYVLEQAQFVPGSTRVFDRNVTGCFNVLKEFLVNDVLAHDAPPRILETTIRQDVEDKV